MCICIVTHQADICSDFTRCNDARFFLVASVLLQQRRQWAQRFNKTEHPAYALCILHNLLLHIVYDKTERTPIVRVRLSKAGRTEWPSYRFTGCDASDQAPPSFIGTSMQIYMYNVCISHFQYYIHMASIECEVIHPSCYILLDSYFIAIYRNLWIYARQISTSTTPLYLSAEKEKL